MRALESAYRSLCSGLVMKDTRFRQAFLLLLVTAISAAFIAMIRAFLLTILLAAIFTRLDSTRCISGCSAGGGGGRRLRRSQRCCCCWCW